MPTTTSPAARAFTGHRAADYRRDPAVISSRMMPAVGDFPSTTTLPNLRKYRRRTASLGGAKRSHSLYPSSSGAAARRLLAVRSSQRREAYRQPHQRGWSIRSLALVGFHAGSGNRRTGGSRAPILENSRSRRAWPSRQVLTGHPDEGAGEVREAGRRRLVGQDARVELLRQPVPVAHPRPDRRSGAARSPPRRGDARDCPPG